MEENYTIKVLRGPDRVRKRPAVMFGDAGVSGAATAVISLLDIFVTEAALGFSTGIEVVIHKDNSVSARSFDRGFTLDETIVDGKPAWYQDFCELYAGPREPDETHTYSFGSQHDNFYGKSESCTPKYQVDTDHGYNMCAVQYVSRFMHIEATRDGIKKTLDFEKGYCVSEIKKETVSINPNTYIHFLLDDEVFDDINFSHCELHDYLRNTAITLPGFKCSLKDNRDNLSFAFLYPNGVEDYLRNIVPPLAMPLYRKEIEATGKDRYDRKEYAAKVRVAFAFVEDMPNILCLHNYRRLEHGGEHLEAIKESIMHYINWEFIMDFRDENSHNDEDNYYSRRRFELSFDDVVQNIALVIETNCTQRATDYLNGTKKYIKNRMITDMANDLISQEFGYYLRKNHNAIFPILEEIQRKKIMKRNKDEIK